VFGPPKTDSSYRTLDLVPDLVAVLAEWKLRSLFKADTDMVFTDRTGLPLHLSRFTKATRRAFWQIPDVRRINLHGLRHSFASILLLQGRPVTQVAKLLGHKDPSITLTVYSHWFDDAEEKNREAMAELASAMLNGSGSKTVATATA
jgi:integrase